MGWASFINRHKRVLPLYEEVGRKKLITFEAEPSGKCRADMWFERTNSILVKEMLSATQEFGFSALIETYLSGQIIGFGPRIFRLSRVDCEALEVMKLNVSLSDYFQPFPTMIIEFPDDYLRKKTVSCAQAGEVEFGQLMPKEHRPEFSVIHHEATQNLILVGSYLTSGQVLTSSLHPNTANPTQLTIEDILADTYNFFAHSLNTNSEEQEAFVSIIRASLNIALMATSEGMGLEKKPFDNESYRRRLEERIRKAQKKQDKEGEKTALRELRLQAPIYGFKQSVTLYDKAERKDLPQGHTGIRLTPHWRRGHYHHYWVGSGDERRRIRRAIKSIFVNRELFAGEEGNTEVSYNL